MVFLFREFPFPLGGKAALFYWCPPCNYLVFTDTIKSKTCVYSVRVVPSKQHTCCYNSTGEDKDSKTKTSSISEFNTLVWDQRANFSA